MADTLVKMAADFNTTLASKVVAGATTATLESVVDDDGNTLSTGTYGLTIDRLNPASKEYIQCTLTGTALTDIRTINRQTGVSSSGFANAHRKGAEVIISDFVAIRRIQDVLENGYASATTPVGDYELATKKYVDDIALGGSTTVDRLTVAGTAGETLAAGDVVYLKSSDGRWWLADADTASSSENVTLGIAQGSGTASNIISGGVLLRGLDSNQTGLSANTIYYISDTAGEISSSTGTKEVTAGIALSTTSILFDPRYDQQLTEDEQDALVGTLGTPSSTNKFVTENGTSSASVDQSQTTRNAGTPVGEADATTKRNDIAQSFIPAIPTISAVKLYKDADTGSFTGTVTISIQADSSGDPSGSALATVTLTNAQWLALATGEFTAKFGTEYSSLVIGDTYHIVVETSTSDTSNCINLGTNSSGGYGSGSVKYKNTTDGWTAISTIDLYFKTVEGIVDKVVVTGSDGYIPTNMNPRMGSLSYVYYNTKNTSDATTTLTITHNLGSIPSYVRATGFYANSTDYGTFTGVARITTAGSVTYSYISLASDGTGAGQADTGTNALMNMFISSSGPHQQKVTITKASEDILELTFTKSGTPNTSIPYMIEIFI